MTNANESASSLTKLEYFAAMAMQGLLANENHSQKWSFTFFDKFRYWLGIKVNIKSSFSNDTITQSVKIANDLIKALNETQVK